MKPIRTLTVLLTILLTFCSCIKDKEGDADQYVGVYKVSVVQNVTWGGSSGTLTDSGTITITKLSSNQIQIRGYFSTNGRVSGNTVYFESMSSSDEAGNINTVFDAGIYNGGTITVNVTRTGQLRNNGVLYPFTSIDRMTIIKQ